MMKTSIVCEHVVSINTVFKKKKTLPHVTTALIGVKRVPFKTRNGKKLTYFNTVPFVERPIFHAVVLRISLVFVCPIENGTLC